MSDNEHAHGNYARKVLEDTGRYAHELLAKNNELRALVAQLQVQEQHAQAEIAELRAANEQVKELKRRLAEAEQEARQLREELEDARAAKEAHARDQQRLHELLQQIDKDARRYDDEFTRLQQQANNLANLYVAVDRLHGTLDRDELVMAVNEIVANLIGCEEVALFELDSDRQRLVLVGSNGIDPDTCREISVQAGLIGAAVRGGSALVVERHAERGPGEQHLTAVVPLRLVDRVNGAIAIFRLLPQKSGIEALDRELFEVLAAHAGMALHCTELTGAGGRAGRPARP